MEIYDAQAEFIQGLDAIHPRVKHRISGQEGVLISRYGWYAAVRFDGEEYASTVSADSIHRLT